MTSTAIPELVGIPSFPGVAGSVDPAVTSWHSVCRVQDLEPDWGEAALVEGRQVALFLLSSGAVYAVEQRDPVTGAHVMARGIVGSRAGQATIASPLHKQVYRLSDGACLDGAGSSLAAFPTRVVGDEIQVAA
ncbi:MULTISPECIES: nitrite reductase small subunit NirD [Arthrobacter]|uniref:Nitrite reductase small subunit NirD n=2 Tax=Arthrobacter TaxID=1663 RepID=A0ABU9KN25_9MICC|nr:nitrite reductase small subunit NirD [Arthrobacter sp. YJM1]MDP5228257.1 nitrite reductase small subunit NirD [Arthrobacter sp. YJM1]